MVVSDVMKRGESVPPLSAGRLPGLEIQPVKRRKLHEHVAETIRNLMLEGKLNPGDALPPERDLARQFDVSRVTIREAVRTLQLWGLIETRHGGGNYVSVPSIERMVEPLSAVIQSNPALQTELLDARGVFEPAICRLAAERCTPDDLETLQTILARQAERVARGELAVEEDCDFHLALARASRNRVVVQVIQMINDLLLESRLRSLRTPDRPRRSLEGHQHILAALRLNDADAACQAMQHHIEGIGRSLRIAEGIENGQAAAASRAPHAGRPSPRDA